MSGTKSTSGKPPMELLPYAGLAAGARGMAFGALMYEEGNWRLGLKWGDLIGAIMRHASAYADGEQYDAASGLSHVDHIIAGAMILAAHERDNLGNNNVMRDDNDINKYEDYSSDDNLDGDYRQCTITDCGICNRDRGRGDEAGDSEDALEDIDTVRY